METLHGFGLIVHIVSGFTALFTGTLIMLLKKGGGTHRKVGRVFFYALLAVTGSAFVLSVIHPNAFLFMVSAFSLYQVLNGYRAVKNKAQHFSWVDPLITTLGAVNTVAMLLTGKVILLVFAGISTFLVIGDIRTHALTLRGKPVPRLLWLQRHIGHMMGGFIATVTAFLVVNIAAGDLVLLVWLGPTAVGIPLIAYWTRKFVGVPRRAAAARVAVS